jgi:ribose transport system ATP-binding protein
MMVGRDLATIYPVKRATRGEELLSVAHLDCERAFHDVTFQVHAGEIVGMFGLLGAGHVEVSKALFGIEPAANGEIKIAGKALRLKDPRDAKQVNIGFVPEDRKIDGLVPGMTVTENLILANWKKLSRYGVLRQGRVRQHATQWIERLRIRTAREGQQEVRTLSGGNQQKVVLARWLEVGSQLLILNEPTRGVDIGARADIYVVLESLREQGLGLLLVSSDMEEVLAMSNRVLVFARGQLVAEIDPSQTNQETLLTIAAGGDA